MQPPHPRTYVRKAGASKRAARDKRIVDEYFTGQYSLEELAEHLGISTATVSRAIGKHFKQLAKKRERDRSDEN